MSLNDFIFNENNNFNSSSNKEPDLNNNNISQISLNDNIEYHNQSAVINSNNYNKILNNISAIQDINQNSNNSFNYVSHNNINNLISDINSTKLEEKAKYIITIINKTISNLKIDPILCSMGKEPMLFEFYKNRILEIISEKLTNEQEKIINKLEKQNNQINNELYLLSQKLGEINRYTKEEKEKIIQNIQNLEKELEIKTEQNTKLFEQIESMTNDLNTKNQQIVFFSK